MRLEETPVACALFKTALGWSGIAWSAQGVRRLVLPSRQAALTRRELQLAAPCEQPPPPCVAQWIARLQAYFEGEPQDFSDVHIDVPNASPFALRVYQQTRQLTTGHTLSYGELARKLGAPGAARAVGRALGANPVPIIVPCHRVLARDGQLGGFSAPGGLNTKQQLLNLERIQIDTPKTTLCPDTQPFDRLAARTHLRIADPQLRRAIDQVGELQLTLQPAPNALIALAESIVHQQLTGKAASTIWNRVLALFPREISAEEVSAIPDTELRKAGLSHTKIRSLKDLANHTLAGKIPTLSELKTLPDEEIVGRLTCVRGIGRWTVEMLLIFRLGRADVLPASDYGVRKGFAAVFKTANLPSPKELLQYGERWKPYRSAAAWYLWRAAEQTPQRKTKAV